MIYEGVQFLNNKFVFDFKNDTNNDIIHLKWSNTKTLSKMYGIKIYSAYRLLANENTSLFRKELKHDSSFIDNKDKEQLINKAVIGFNSIYPISNFDLIIYPKSSSELNSILAHKVKEKASSVKCADEGFVKSAIKDIKIDYDSFLNSAKTPEEKEKRKKQLDYDLKHSTETGTFQIKKVHQFRKKLFSNYIKFNSENSKEIYNLINNNGRILIVDDILTTGSTLGEMIKLLYQYNVSEIVFFCLIR